MRRLPWCRVQPVMALKETETAFDCRGDKGNLGHYQFSPNKSIIKMYHCVVFPFFILHPY